MPHCSDIMTIGRVKWIEGSKYTGKDNHAWYRFDIRHKSGPVFHGRGHAEMIPPRTGVCEQCGKRYAPQRSSSRFCSPACKQSAHHKKIANAYLYVQSALSVLGSQACSAFRSAALICR